MGFDRQSRRRISRSVLFTERLNRSRTPRVGGNRNPSKNPIYWAVATEDIVRGLSGTVQLVGSNGSPIAGETRTAFNDYETTVWQDANCIITIVDEEFRIIDADVATILLCSTTGPVSSGTASFSASVIKDLDGYYGKATITAQNTFSQEYDPSELFLAFRNEEDKTWVADKVGGSGGNEVLVRFELYPTGMTLAATSAAAETLDQAGVKTGTEITVHDRVGEWAGDAGYQGIAFRGDNVAGEYDIVFLEAKARWIRGTLNAPLEGGGSVTFTVTSYFGAAPNGRDPGTTVSVIDATGLYFWARSGDVCLAVWNEKQARYEVVWVEFRADVFAVDLATDGGSDGSNAVASCTLTYQVRNADSGELLGSNIAPRHPRPSQTQMIAATAGIAHWELVEDLAELVLDHAFEVPTPRVAYSAVTSVTCNATAGLDIWRRNVFLPAGSRVDAQILGSTLLCTGGAEFSPGCGIVETTPGSGIYQVNPNDLAGDGLTLDSTLPCGLAIDHDTCTLEMTGTSPNKKLQVRLEAAATGGLLCSGDGVKVDPTTDATHVLNNITGCTLEIDTINELFKVTLNFTPYTIQRNAAGIDIGGTFGTPTTLTACAIMTAECP